jgi:hypothetical protein
MGFGEFFKRPVVSLLDVVRKAACWQLAHLQVISDALAAHALLRARIGAVAVLQVLLFLAIHVIGWNINPGYLNFSHCIHWFIK